MYGRTLLLAVPALAASLVGHQAVPKNVVRFKAHENCWVGFTENQAAAQKGEFFLHYLAKGQSYNLKVSKDKAILCYGATPSPAYGAPMPHFPQKGIVFGGSTMLVP